MNASARCRKAEPCLGIHVRVSTSSFRRPRRMWITSPRDRIEIIESVGFLTALAGLMRHPCGGSTRMRLPPSSGTTVIPAPLLLRPFRERLTSSRSWIHGRCKILTLSYCRRQRRATRKMLFSRRRYIFPNRRNRGSWGSLMRMSRQSRMNVHVIANSSSRSSRFARPRRGCSGLILQNAFPTTELRFGGRSGCGKTRV